jgi:hypothetical protein
MILHVVDHTMGEALKTRVRLKSARSFDEQDQKAACVIPNVCRFSENTG